MLPIIGRVSGVTVGGGLVKDRECVRLLCGHLRMNNGYSAVRASVMPTCRLSWNQYDGNN